MKRKKVAIVDRDGVFANVEKRMAKADEEYQLALDQGASEQDAQERKWRVFFNPYLVPLDTPIAGADVALRALENEGYSLIILTSEQEWRPYLRDALTNWSKQYLSYYQASWGMIMKPPAEQFTKTPRWKAGVVQMLAAFHDAEEVLFVDDEQKNREELIESAPGMAAKYGMWCCVSLDYALDVLAARGEGAL